MTHNCAFSITLTTLALYQSSLWLFEACSCKPAPRGPPSSTAQLQHFPCFYGAQPSTSKEFGEAIGEKSRAEVYTYDPINGKVGDKVAKLNTTILHGDTICSYLLALGTSYGKSDYDDRYFPINSKKIIVQKEENGSYEIEIDNPLLNIREKSTKVSKEMINLFLDDLLCLCDESVLSDGYGVEISGW